MNDKEFLRLVLHQFELIHRFAISQTVHVIKDGKPVRVSIKKAIAMECNAAILAIETELSK